MEATELLQKYFHFSVFRALQGKIVNSIISGHDTVALLPTGGGKSICYQIPGLFFAQTGGVTLVISPLIALMKDQVDNLRQKNISATFLNHSLSTAEMSERLHHVENGKYVFVYVSPERLQLLSFVEICRKLPLRLIAIDEAHCISQWGHHFRPEYLLILRFIEQLPRRPIIAAFTATAPPAVKKEIITSLKLHQPHLFQGSFFRRNLRFSVIHCANPSDQELTLLHLIKRYQGKVGIIYCSTRSKTENVAELLNHFNFRCRFYHGGMESEQRTIVQDEFLTNKQSLIVATNAFGMGVDKPDVSFVIHFNFPAHLEAYYQEAGRAGRDGNESECYLLFAESDIEPQLALIKNQTSTQLKTSEQKLKMMLRYMTTRSCRLKIMFEYLGEKTNKNQCKNCDVCYPLKRKAEEDRQLHKLKKISNSLQKLHSTFPIFNRQLAAYFFFYQPHTRIEYLKLPGIGKGWLKKYYSFFAVELLTNVLEN